MYIPSLADRKEKYRQTKRWGNHSKHKRKEIVILDKTLFWIPDNSKTYKVYASAEVFFFFSFIVIHTCDISMESFCEFWPYFK